MRFLLSAGVCVIVLYAVDVWCCGGMYFDAAREMAMQWHEHF